MKRTSSRWRSRLGQVPVGAVINAAVAVLAPLLALPVTLLVGWWNEKPIPPLDDPAPLVVSAEEWQRLVDATAEPAGAYAFVVGGLGADPASVAAVVQEIGDFAQARPGKDWIGLAVPGSGAFAGTGGVPVGQGLDLSRPVLAVDPDAVA